MAAAGLDAPSIEASVSSKLFNSGHTLGSFLDVGNTSSASTQPPIEIQDDASPPMKLTTSSSGALSSPPSARTPRTGQATSGSEDSDVMVHYPPASSSPSTSLLSASKHPNLLPQHQNSSLDPSPTSSNNSSAPPSFEYMRSVPSDRLAVNHPSSSYHQASLSHSGGLTESSTGLLAHDHVSGEPSHSNSHDLYNSQANGFAKVSGGRKSMQVFGTPPVGIIGVHKPREIIRLDRDYSSGEICQFWSGFPIELEGRVSSFEASHFSAYINTDCAAISGHRDTASECYE